jgi:hypothetical protein
MDDLKIAARENEGNALETKVNEIPSSEKNYK